MNKSRVSQSSVESYFKASERSEVTSKQVRKKERAADAAKTARLRSLRLAKEAADKLAADESGASSDAKVKRAGKRSSAAKPPVVRLVY